MAWYNQGWSSDWGWDSGVPAPQKGWGKGQNKGWGKPPKGAAAYAGQNAGGNKTWTPGAAPAAASSDAGGPTTSITSTTATTTTTSTTTSNSAAGGVSTAVTAGTASSAATGTTATVTTTLNSQNQGFAPNPAKPGPSPRVNAALNGSKGGAGSVGGGRSNVASAAKAGSATAGGSASSTSASSSSVVGSSKTANSSGSANNSSANNINSSAGPNPLVGGSRAGPQHKNFRSAAQKTAATLNDKNKPEDSLDSESAQTPKVDRSHLSYTAASHMRNSTGSCPPGQNLASAAKVDRSHLSAASTGEKIMASAAKVDRSHLSAASAGENLASAAKVDRSHLSYTAASHMRNSTGFCPPGHAPNKTSTAKANNSTNASSLHSSAASADEKIMASAAKVDRSYTAASHMRKKAVDRSHLSATTAGENLAEAKAASGLAKGSAAKGPKGGGLGSTTSSIKGSHGGGLGVFPAVSTTGTSPSALKTQGGKTNFKDSKQQNSAAAHSSRTSSSSSGGTVSVGGGHHLNKNHFQLICNQGPLGSDVSSGHHQSTSTNNSGGTTPSHGLAAVTAAKNILPGESIPHHLTYRPTIGDLQNLIARLLCCSGTDDDSPFGRFSLDGAHVQSAWDLVPKDGFGGTKQMNVSKQKQNSFISGENWIKIFPSMCRTVRRVCVVLLPNVGSPSAMRKVGHYTGKLANTAGAGAGASASASTSTNQEEVVVHQHPVLEYFRSVVGSAGGTSAAGSTSSAGVTTTTTDSSLSVSLASLEAMPVMPFLSSMLSKPWAHANLARGFYPESGTLLKEILLAKLRVAREAREGAAPKVAAPAFTTRVLAPSGGTSGGTSGTSAGGGAVPSSAAPSGAAAAGTVAGTTQGSVSQSKEVASRNMARVAVRGTWRE